ncbi:hypothetical protein L3X38_025919 [Prunus dulcis]|uniref:Uncharacterized protein n=1 Tax=Prunus dulcis TaxID=3755 RepID=A0AAD4Z7H9_PRUDU|nr:hypothetical protein L3X38_025919 [Prunus dulcis]
MSNSCIPQLFWFSAIFSIGYSHQSSPGAQALASEQARPPSGSTSLDFLYKVPWILKWSYRITKDARIFARQFSVKWWDKFEVQRIAKYVYNDLPAEPQATSLAGSVRSSLSVEGKSKSEL